MLTIQWVKLLKTTILKNSATFIILIYSKVELFVSSMKHTALHLGPQWAQTQKVNLWYWHSRASNRRVKLQCMLPKHQRQGRDLKKTKQNKKQRNKQQVSKIWKVRCLTPKISSKINEQRRFASGSSWGLGCLG